jgi:hypothetical protein
VGIAGLTKEGKTMETLILNLATGEEQIYTCEPLDALISAAILASNQASQVSNPITRNKFSKRVIFGKNTAGLDDFAVKLI